MPYLPFGVVSCPTSLSNVSRFLPSCRACVVPNIPVGRVSCPTFLSGVCRALPSCRAYRGATTRLCSRRCARRVAATPGSRSERPERGTARPPGWGLREMSSVKGKATPPGWELLDSSGDSNPSGLDGGSNNTQWNWGLK